MSAIKNSGVGANAYHLRSGSNNTISWSDLDKTRLYTIGEYLQSASIRCVLFKFVQLTSIPINFMPGTGMYSGLTVLLHPLTVLKIRKQTGSTVKNSGANNIRQYYRGLGVVLSMAIPARILYISTLEYTRETTENIANSLIMNPPSSIPLSQAELQPLLPLVAPFSGGVAGGVAALSSQMVVVPMDVISQKQMVAESPISVREVTRTIVSTEGYGGLFRGFGLSLVTSLPAGSIWWATYAGSKDQLLKMNLGFGKENQSSHSGTAMARSALIQVASAFNAAFAAAVITQPLDTIKTRLQVLGTSSGSSILSTTKALASTGKLYQGLIPRIAHMGIWGSVLSSAYEYLKIVSRKDACD